MLSDIEIALGAKIRPIMEIAESIGVHADEIIPYGRYKAKLENDLENRLADRPNGKLILVTAVNPTPLGEGKTTITVGLGQAMAKIGKKAIIALREPSLGPVFGIKGGAAGGGYAQVLPMEDINLHFTGDLHAITSANNLLCALLDNHLQQGNSLSIDQRKIYIKRCLDMNDRSLRKVIIGLGGRFSGIPREDSFQITVASEVMAILCLARNVSELKTRLGNILVAKTMDDRPVFASDLCAQGAMAALLKDAINPNLVQTLEGTPALIHGGPFANIAHGCSSVRATRLALKLGDYCITEAGFGSDLGAEKFFDIKCRLSGLSPAAAVLVATVRALKYNGGVKKDELTITNLPALEKGLENLAAHIENLKGFGVNVVVALNRFDTDSTAEIELIRNYCEENGAAFALSEVFTKGGEGGMELASKVVEAADSPSAFSPIYPSDLPLQEKINVIATKVYGAKGVNYTDTGRKALREAIVLGGDHVPVCIAKTQYSLSDDPSLLGRPRDFDITVSDVRLMNGAGFAVVYTGDVMTMPGLPRIPSSEKIDIDEDNHITGLF